MTARPVPRLAFTLDEAATSLGVSRNHFCRHILPDLKVVYTGSVRSIPVSELERWIDKNSIPARPVSA